MMTPLLRRWILWTPLGCLGLGWVALPASTLHAEEPGVSVSTEVANSPDPFPIVLAQLRSVALVEADFEEDKTMQMLSHPLQSSGTLLFSPQRGVYRVMLSPLHQELLITHARLIQKDAAGNVERIDVKRQPAAQVFVNIFLSFFAGEEESWKKFFAVSFEGTVDQWRLHFLSLPTTPLAKAIQRIDLEGHQGVLDAMTLTETNGDTTRTRYSHQKTYSAAEAESALRRFPSDLTSL